MKRTIFSCDVCGKECEQAELIVFSHTDMLSGETTVDICKDCVDRITEKKPRADAVKKCKYAGIEKIPGGKVLCLNRNSKRTICSGFGKCHKFEQEEW